MDLERVLGSRGRVRILRILARAGGLNVTRLAREAGLSYETTVGHVRLLAEEGVVRERRLGRVRIVELATDRPEVRRIVSLLSPAAADGR